MSNSKLVNYTKISPNSNNPRNHAIDKITIHHMAGNLSIETCGNAFASTSRQASSNYGIGSDGRIGMYVEEKNRSWCSSSRDNDHRAITIEVANDGDASTNWHVSDKALESLINLCVDICQRNGIKSLNYTGDKNGNLTRHNMFYATTCPGPYLQSKFPYIAEEVNKRLNGNSSSSNTTPSTSTITYQVYDNKKKYWLPNVKVNSNDYAGNFGNPIGGIYIDNLEYRTYDNVKKKWLPWVEGRKDYAGNLGNSIGGIQIKNATYRVHIKGGNWLDWVSKVDDTNNGYAGIYGKEIDAIQIK